MQADQLAQNLADRLRGEVRFDKTSRLLYSTDASLYQIMPVGVVFPRDAEDVVTTVRIAAEAGVPVLPRGSGTSLGGQTVGAAVVLDFSRHMNRILELDTRGRRARVQPGVILDDLNRFLKPYGLLFGPDVATSNRASIGGMIGNNSCGAHSIRYGKTVDHVLALDVVLASGETTRFEDCGVRSAECGIGTTADPTLPDTPHSAIRNPQSPEGRLLADVKRIVAANRAEIERRFPRIMRRVGGYNLDAFLREGPRNLSSLIVGSEGTLAAVTAATLNLVPAPRYTALAILHFDDLIASLEATREILPFEPWAVELTDKYILDLTLGNLELAPARSFLVGDPQAVLMVEFSGDSRAEVVERIAAMEAHLNRPGAPARPYATARALEAPEQAQAWKVRKAGLGLLMGMKGDRKPVGFVEDTAVAPEVLPEYIRRFQGILRKYDADAVFYAHASVGCLHVRPILDLKRPDDRGRMRAIAEEVSDLVLEFGGAMSAEHGDGLVRSEWNRKMFGPQLYRAFQEVKAAFDPQGIMNPGKIVDSPRMDENLRVSRGGQPLQIETHFDFSRDGGIAAAAELCSGVGACRKRFEGGMCPSYRATMDEMHTTRARANMLRAVLSGALPPEEFTGKGMHDVMDLCIQCKACKAECPSNVDMARLKAEFLAHSNADHGTPLRSQLFGNVAAGSRLASRVAPLANWALGLPAAKRALHRFVGITTRRELPRYTAVTFPEWFRSHRPHPAAGTRGTVALLNDTFMNYHEPEIGIAATRVLEACGYAVELTEMECCGRPQIAKGLLAQAKSAARRNLARLKALVDRGLPILGCEPSCLVTLKDEYLDLAGGDDARAVAAASELVEAFLARELVEAAELPFHPRPVRALLHGHCHQKALLGTRPTLAALRLVPELEVAEIPSGCCGMAGSFGYEAEHYDVSLRIGEEILFPTIRAAPPDVLLVAPGTSCRDQILHATGREALHPVEVLAEALAPGGETGGGGDAETRGRGDAESSRKRQMALRLLIGAAVAGVAVLATARTLGDGSLHHGGSEGTEEMMSPGG